MMFSLWRGGIGTVARCGPFRSPAAATGTDPTEGSALGIALLRALVRGGPSGAALTVASTHHGALTALKYEDERFENASVGALPFGPGAR